MPNFLIPIECHDYVDGKPHEQHSLRLCSSRIPLRCIRASLKRPLLSSPRAYIFISFSFLGNFDQFMFKDKKFSGFSPRSMPHDVIGGLASIYCDGLYPSPERGPTFRNLLSLKMPLLS